MECRASGAKSTCPPLRCVTLNGNEWKRRGFVFSLQPRNRLTINQINCASLWPFTLSSRLVMQLPVRAASFLVEFLADDTAELRSDFAYYAWYSIFCLLSLSCLKITCASNSSTRRPLTGNRPLKSLASLTIDDGFIAATKRQSISCWCLVQTSF